jgi:hypothetical protein
MCDEIEPGADPSYEICKILFLYHPIGQKLAETPIKMAMRLPRVIKIPGGPEDDLVKAFNDQYERDSCHQNIRALATLARVYGNASVALLEKGKDPRTPVKWDELSRADISYNVLDPLNTAGSLVLDQNPNSITFQKHVGISVAGTPYDRSRSVTLFNEQPIYIAYTSSAFGFSGRSVYQRALFPLKSFINTMRADDMVARKAGLIVATIKMVGSVIDAIMNTAAAFKRRMLKVAETDNVISINEGERVESLNLQNLEGPLSVARRNIIENIATAADMPAKILLQETFAEGFGEGTEDANYVADYLDQMRVWLEPAYRFFDHATMHRAWNREFHASLLAKYGKDIGEDYEECFYRWKNSFEATWPTLRREPESVRVQLEETKLQAQLVVAQTLLPIADPDNMGKVLEWLQANLNSSSNLFTNDLDLDIDALVAHAEEQAKQQQEMQDQATEGEEGGGSAAQPGAARKDSTVLEAYLRRSTPRSPAEQRIAKIEDYLARHPEVRK